MEPMNKMPAQKDTVIPRSAGGLSYDKQIAAERGMTVSLVWVNRFVHWKPSFGEGSPAQLSGLIALNRFLSEQ
jgi:hypothetical protein